MKLNHSFNVYLRPKAPYSFELTVRKPAGWPLFTPLEIFQKGTLWTALHLDNLLLGLRLSSGGTVSKPQIVLSVFSGESLSPAQKLEIQKILGAKLSVENDLTDFYRLAEKDPILKHSVQDLYGMNDTELSHLYAAVCLSILLQMAPLKRSQEMMECFIRSYGEVAEFEGKRIPVWPTPERVANLSTAELAQKCKLGYWAKYVFQCARFLEQSSLPAFSELKQLSFEEAKNRLLKLPGIGDYSADIISPHRGFPIDVWSADIFSQLFYGAKPGATRTAIEQVKAEGIRRWGKWSWMAFFYIVQDLENLSRKLERDLRLF